MSADYHPLSDVGPGDDACPGCGLNHPENLDCYGHPLDERNQAMAPTRNTIERARMDILGVGDDPFDTVDHICVCKGKAVIADCGPAKYKANRNHAGLIVEAVNAYDTLRAENQAMLQALEISTEAIRAIADPEHQSFSEINGWGKREWQPILATCQAALARARGGKGA